MLRRLLGHIQRRATWPVILGLVSIAGVLSVLMNATDLPFSTPTIEEHSGGLRILDMRLSYEPEEANQLFESLGAEGRRAYRLLHLVPDLLFPITYALAFAATSAWFLLRLLPLDHRLHWLSLTPLVSGAADLLENLSLVIASSLYPNRVDGLLQVASALTTLKFGLMPIGVALLVTMALVWLARGRPGPPTAA